MLGIVKVKLVASRIRRKSLTGSGRGDEGS
jgi:hypothetical protein